MSFSWQKTCNANIHTHATSQRCIEKEKGNEKKNRSNKSNDEMKKHKTNRFDTCCCIMLQARYFGGIFIGRFHTLPFNIINTIHPHPYRMAACVCLHTANLLDWKLVKCTGISLIHWKAQGKRRRARVKKYMNAGASKSNIIYSRYGSSVYFMAKRYR